MELVSCGLVRTLNRSWRRRRYQRVTNGYKKTSKTVTFGGRNRRFWNFKAIPRLRLKKASPIRLWIKLKNAYIDMMLRLGGSESVFGSKRVPRRLQISGGYSMGEFHSRLIYEISKNLIASRELATM
ncbi:hypothetical protein L1987_68411 [Smallanthus sonchifolius]|uniref:Uncharacterized protein n=1 Tax=Smallanthus sonchifolius TaxID=185202 RepID=A0ACB9B5M5_9ASTR|nr:hypothetical protein L1987_68411 [Smallanthus sonchifolius]